jgi:aminopeptidase N
MIRPALVVIGLLGLAAIARAETPTELPRGVRPVSYSVEITPDAGALRFHGEVAIAVDIAQDTDAIVLNATDLSFSSARLVRAEQVETLLVAIDAAHQTVTARAAHRLVAGRYRVEFSYDGPIGTQPNGLFALDYPGPAGSERALYTQFESTDARRMIPCFDEPQFRAPFELSVVAPAGRMVVSNMPAAGQVTLADGRVRTHFPATPPMSSYLLFLAVGDFERATARLGDTELGVVVRRGAVDQAGVALAAQCEILAEYNAYFDVPYPLPKLDNVAAPGNSQFFSAMENWGAIFTFEWNLLADPAIATPGDRAEVFETDAHEMAHQWFGDLVTMRWWDDLWLNESFASWLGSRTTARLHPEWESAFEDIASSSAAMETDALVTTHPIVRRLRTAAEVDEAFDSITYAKGEAVLRMLERHVGADAWRDGIRAYIRAHAYSNTTSDDLWRAVDGVSKAGVGPIARAFTLQPGVPLISVAAHACTDGITPVVLTPSEFRVGPHPGKRAEWPVPVTVTAGGEPTRVVVTHAVTVPVAGCGPVIANPGRSGYYRVRYEPAAFAALLAHAADLAPLDAVALLDDTWALARQGDVPMAAVLDLIAATPAKAPARQWLAVSRVLEQLDGYYGEANAARDAFRRQAIGWLAPLSARLGYVPRQDESMPTSLLRQALIEALSMFGDPTVIAEARRRYAGAAADPGLVPDALRRTLVGVVARHADSAAWESLRVQAGASTSPVMQDYLYAMLGTAEDESLARRALELALGDEPAATISGDIIQAVALRYPDLAFEFAVTHREAVLARVDAMTSDRLIMSLGARSVRADMPGRIRAYIATHLAGLPHRVADEAALRATLRSEIHAQRLGGVEAWLAARR